MGAGGISTEAKEENVKNIGVISLWALLLMAVLAVVLGETFFKPKAATVLGAVSTGSVDSQAVWPSQPETSAGNIYQRFENARLKYIQSSGEATQAALTEWIQIGFELAMDLNRGDVDPRYAGPVLRVMVVTLQNVKLDGLNMERLNGVKLAFDKCVTSYPADCWYKAPSSPP